MSRTKLTILVVLAAFVATMLACSKEKKSNPVAPPPPGTISLRLEPVTSGLSTPVFLTAPANDSRLFIVEKAGRIRIFANGSLVSTPFLDVTGLVGSPDYEQGLLGLAFPSDYASSGKFYISYTDAVGDVHVARYHVSGGDPDVADPTPEANLITVGHSEFTNHNGGMIAWGLDGFLYFSVGDGGDGYDPHGNGQSRTEWLGNILRLDSNGAAAPGNPFSDPDKPEIWCYGLRNPWRFSFDRLNGDLYIGDVGQALHEEIDVATAAQGGGRGLNFGWKIQEGLSCLGDPPCPTTGLTQPVLDYGHTGGACAVVGGFVYRGSAIPALRGTYFYGDNCAGWIRSFKYVNGQVTEAASWSSLTSDGLTSFGQDAAGELYVMTESGTVSRIVSN